MFQIHWRNWNFASQAPLLIALLAFSWDSFSTLAVTSTSGRLRSCAYQLLFEVLREILSLYLVSWGNYCTTLKGDSVIVNYTCWKWLFIPEISSRNKSSIIKRSFHWISTTRTSKIVTISCITWLLACIKGYLF